MTVILKSLSEKSKSPEDDDEEEKESRMKINHLNLVNCELGNKGIVEVSAKFSSFVMVLLFYFST